MVRAHIFFLQTNYTNVFMNLEEEEGPGQFDHYNFDYDRLADYIRGRSPLQWGTRTGKIPPHPNKKDARVRMGFLDKGFLPYDNSINQATIYHDKDLPEAKAKYTEAKKLQSAKKKESKKGKKKRATDGDGSDDGGSGGEEEESGDLELYEYLGIFKPDDENMFGVTDLDQLSASNVYSAFSDDIKYVLRQYGYHKVNVTAVVMASSEWNKCLHEIVNSSGRIHPWIKEDLQDGCYEMVDSSDIDVEATKAANGGVMPDLDDLSDDDDGAPASKKRKRGRPATRAQSNAKSSVPAKGDGKAAPTIVYKKEKKLLPMDEQDFDQRRRWLWPALESIVLGFTKTMKTSIKEEENFNAAVYETYKYYTPESILTARGLTAPETVHPHEIDPPVSVKQKKPAGTTKNKLKTGKFYKTAKSGKATFAPAAKTSTVVAPSP